MKKLHKDYFILVKDKMHFEESMKRIGRKKTKK